MSALPVTHELKAWPAPFQAVRTGAKRYELRKSDRDYRVEDWLHLREWDPDSQAYTGRQLWAQVTYITRGGEWGLPEGLCVLGLGDAQQSASRSIALGANLVVGP